MDILSTRMGNNRLKSVVLAVKQYLLEGNSLSDAFAVFPGIFPAWQVNLIKYSETGGRITEGLTRLADHLERDYALQQNIIVGLAYPVLLLHAAVFLLPLVNIACGIGAYIAGVLKLIIPLYGFIFLIYFSGRMLRFPQFRSVVDGFILGIPVFGNIARQLALTQFIRALQCLCASGVAIITGWKMAAEACGNKVIKDAVLNGLEAIEHGQEISKAFIQARVFSAEMISMITAAEKSGSLVHILNTIATYSEKENETAVAVLVSTIPIFVYLVIAGFIGFRIISFYLSYFNKILSFTR
ncbi:MAG: type II secretion system F family protein [Candidatus Omnitrophota bacterium]